MSDIRYDVLLAGQSEMRCTCGTVAWPGEVVAIIDRRFHCLHCAAMRADAPPIQVALVARALREQAEHIKHKKMRAAAFWQPGPTLLLAAHDIANAD